jgi:hypothetical protein
VRADAYLAVGGFPGAVHAEDQKLVDALEEAGYGIARTRRLTVTTSGRLHGRAAGGLADELRRLSGDQSVCTASKTPPGAATPSGPPLYPSAHRPPELGSHDVSDAANVRI